MPSKLTEAATIKARALRVMRDMAEMLKDKTLPDGLRRQIEDVRSSLKKTWKELGNEAIQAHGRKGVASQSSEILSTYVSKSIDQEATVADKKKTVGGKAYPASDFLVVEDPESPTTWHLQVKREGKPEPRLMGAAFAALTKGYRGNKYEGPDKAKALAALKKMYADNDMATPAESAESEEVAEYGFDNYNGYPSVPGSIISFAQLETAHAAEEIACDLRERVGEFQQMINNIFWNSDVPDKLSALQNLFEEFVLVVGDILTGGGEDDSMAGAEAEITETFAESYEPVFTLVEAEGAVDPRGPLEMDVQLIQPGWGNSRDNHYYPAEMLRRDSHVFEGVKMYVTDHRPDEKSERTEVSQIKKIMGFSEAGAPIGRVVVFDPSFAEKCRNRARAGMLESLECSILADGKARPGFEQGGRKGKVVESIASASSVDWVTRAGAGGKAISLAESADGKPEETPEPVAPVEEVASPDALPVAIREVAPAEEVAPTPAPVEEVSPVEIPVLLTRAEINAALAKTNLPPATLLQLAFAEYATPEALQEAIGAEVKRLKEISGSGRPFGLGESSAPEPAKPVTRASINETMDKINSRFGFGR